jgi:hypothetical protein
MSTDENTSTMSAESTEQATPATPAPAEVELADEHDEAEEASEAPSAAEGEQASPSKKRRRRRKKKAAAEDAPAGPSRKERRGDKDRPPKPERPGGSVADIVAVGTTLRDEGDSRVIAYVLGAFGALPFLAGTPQGFQLLQDSAKSVGQTVPVRGRAPCPYQRPAQAPGGSRRAATFRRSPWTAPQSCRRGTAAQS